MIEMKSDQYAGVFGVLIVALLLNRLLGELEFLIFV